MKLGRVWELNRTRSGKLPRRNQAWHDRQKTIDIQIIRNMTLRPGDVFESMLTKTRYQVLPSGAWKRA